jgi:transcription elongation factor GreA
MASADENAAEQVNLMTAVGLDELNAELATLEGDGRRQIAERIKTAREWGDLKENSEYHDAKNDQAHLELKIATLRKKISTAVVVDESRPDDAIGLGSTVVVRDSSGDERSWRIVSSRDGSPAEGLLSVHSPVARALMGRRPGEEVSVTLPEGVSVLMVLNVG